MDESSPNAEARRLGYTKRRFKGLDQAPKYVSPTLTYVYGHDYSFTTGQEVSILTLCGRIHLPYQGYQQHTTLIQQGTVIGEAKLWYDRAKKRFYLLAHQTQAWEEGEQEAAPGQPACLQVGVC